ncbi:hypothetical protein BT96DRAFT_951303 [Gymnopus androsaceus JB14]|uniref:Uncharacterized protein n=1 Tax=Gymnopus androsaceus JB14 TaxID=1447944 RepID=A0A6A4GDJ1_9AGAR|nr:hypothetical protein BT96DRAFT_951303 [Gymnopus androsaceus JB14]
MSQTTIPPLNRSPASADTSGLQSSLLKPKVRKNLDDNTESQKVDNDAGKQPKKVQSEAIPPWERKQCPIPGYDLEAMEAMQAESSPTPTLIELDEEDIPLDLEQRGIKVRDYAFPPSGIKPDGATKQC